MTKWAIESFSSCIFYFYSYLFLLKFKSQLTYFASFERILLVSIHKMHSIVSSSCLFAIKTVFCCCVQRINIKYSLRLVHSRILFNKEPKLFNQFIFLLRITLLKSIRALFQKVHSIHCFFSFLFLLLSFSKAVKNI